MTRRPVTLALTILCVLTGVLLAAGCGDVTAPKTAAPGPGEQPAAPPPAERKPEGVPKLDDIAVVQLRLGLPIRSEEAPQPLRPGEPGELAVMLKLLAWLNAAQVVAGEIHPPGRAPSLGIELKSGGVVAVRPAADCVVTKRPDGSEQRCQHAEGQVEFYAGGSRPPVRLRAPELATWLQGGWEQDIRRGPVQK